jgi:pyruvate/2-oxoglutarate dehydrogenase complex dihydrolipoamide acyltransferase (E2) component
MRLEAVMLPELGAGPDIPIVISHWFAARGAEVGVGERLVEIRVGPATFDVPAPVTGRLNEIRVHEDDPVRPGAVLGFVAVTEHDREDRNLAVDDSDGRDSDRLSRLPPISRSS